MKIDAKKQEQLRQLPGVDKVLERMLEDETIAALPAGLVTLQARKAVARERERIIADKGGCAANVELIAERGKQLTIASIQPRLRRVINASGVVLHTNLGRAPLSMRALQLIEETARGYSNLEFELSSGRRGSRYNHVVEKICLLTGAEDALIVNNNAAAVMLMLAALAKGREVVVSRGELVEIGGSFRIPAVMEQSGATLIEVGTTNKTHLRDYRAAITEQTALLMKVHTSNYRIIGFTAQPTDEELVELGRSNNLAVVEDLGGGSLVSLDLPGWYEPTVAEKLSTGFDLVTCSGDKLMGAGQAGIIVGKRKYIEVLKQHQLLRALRIDKLSLAALEGTLCDYLAGCLAEIPTLRMLTAGDAELTKRQNDLCKCLRSLPEGWKLECVTLASMAGGGTLPEVEFPSCGIALTPPANDVAAVERFLRSWRVPIVARVQEGRILFDVRSLLDGDAEEIAAACMAWEDEATK